MKSVSKAALAAAFVMSAPALLAASPALAQKKKEEAAAGPQIKLSEPFRKAAAEVQTLVNAKDWALVAAPMRAASLGMSWVKILTITFYG